MSKEIDIDKGVKYLENARSWIYKAQNIANKYNIETDYLASLGCSIDEAIGELENG